MNQVITMILVILTTQVYSQWAQVTGIEAGRVEATFIGTVAISNTSINNTVSKQMKVLSLVPGFSNFQMSQTDIHFNMEVTFRSYSTYFTLTVQWSSTLLISKWIISYFAFDRNIIKGLETIYFYFNQSSSSLQVMTYQYDTYENMTNITSMTHFVSYLRISTSQIIDYFKTTLQYGPDLILKVILKLGISSGVRYVRGYILRVDENLLLLTNNAIIDIGHFSGYNGILSPITISSNLITSDFAVAFYGLAVKKARNVSFQITNNGQISILTGPFQQIYMTYINARKQDCNYTNLYQITTNGTCVNDCPTTFFYKVQVAKKCQPCNYTCLTCSDSDNCLTCNNTNKRTFQNSNKQCPCDAAFYNNGVALCSSCKPNCIYCTNLSVCINCISTLINFTFDSNYYLVKYVLTSTKGCSLCSSLMIRCHQCSSFNVCLKCFITNFTVSPTKDSCICNHDYVVYGTGCALCKDLVFGCISCVDNLTCSLCDQNKKFTLNNGACVCQTNYYLNNDICCHYSCSSCQAPDLCLQCSSLNKRTLTIDKKCLCNDMFYDNNSALCLPCMSVCSTCKSGTTCQTCSITRNLTLVGTNCACFQNYVWMTPNCQFCSDVILGCVTCNHNMSCKSCNSPNFTLSTDTTNCYCSQQYYSFGILCHHCSQIHEGCIQCASKLACSKCLTPNYTLQANSMCQCDNINNYYALNNNCVHCHDLIFGCQTCSSTTICKTCFLTNYTMGIQNQTCNCNEITQFFFSINKCIFCIDIIFGCLNCSNNSTCIQCDTASFFKLDGNSCVCIDGYYLSGKNCLKCQISCLTCVGVDTYCLTCNNTALRFFNDNKCICRQYFSDCRTSDNDDCSNNSCHFLSPINFQLKQLIKDPLKNNLNYQIAISPILNEFENLNISDIFSIGLPKGTNIQYSYSAGVVFAEVQYHQNMQNNLTNMTFDLNKTDFWYFQLTPQSVFSYFINATNNLASNYYSDNIYSQKLFLEKVVTITVVVGLLVFFIGLFSNKIVVSQMVGVMQISYIGLFIINHSDPLINSLNMLEYTNGINNLIQTTQQNAPNRIFSIGYSSSLISNLNIMLLFLLLPLVCSVIFYVIHLKSTKYRIKMQKACRLALGEWLMTVILFILYNYSCSMITVFIFSKTSQIQFIISILELVLISLMFAFVIYIFIKKDYIWNGQFKANFNWNKFSQFYYFYPIIQRVFIGILLTAGNITYISAIVSIVVIICGIVIVAIKKPFIKGYQNYRSIVVNVYGIIILTLYLCLSINGPSKGQSTFTYFPYIIMGVVITNILTGIIFVIVHFKVNIQNKLNQRQCQIQQNADAQLKMDLNRNVQKIIRQAKNKNTHNILLKGGKKKRLADKFNPLYQSVLRQQQNGEAFKGLEEMQLI